MVLFAKIIATTSTTMNRVSRMVLQTCLPSSLLLPSNPPIVSKATVAPLKRYNVHQRAMSPIVDSTGLHYDWLNIVKLCLQIISKTSQQRNNLTVEHAHNHVRKRTYNFV